MNIIDQGGSIGKRQGVEAPAWIRDEDGARYDFNREAIEDEEGGCPLNQLANDERLLAPGLIYKEALPETTSDPAGRISELVMWKIKRLDTKNIVIQHKDGSGCIAADNDKENIAACMLYRLASDLLAT